MRLLALTVGVLCVVGMALLSIRFWGLSLPIETFHHPWMQKPTPWIVVPEGLVAQAGPQAIVWIDVVESQEKNLYAVPQDLDPSQKKWTDAQLQGRGKPLKEDLAGWEGRDLILNIRSNAENIDLQISDLIGKAGLGHVLIQSDYDLIMQSIKNLQPLWLFGSSQADRVRFGSFASLGVLPATPFKGDVYIGPFRQHGIELLTPAILHELKRRGKKVIVGPLEKKEDRDQALRLGADGLFIDQPELLGLPSAL